MDALVRLKEVIDRFDLEDPPTNKLTIFRTSRVRELAFSIYHSRRNQRKEDWLDASDPNSHMRVMAWLKENPHHVRPL